MSEITSPDNPCGHDLLNIVSRGSAIIAEIQRLCKYIPHEFLDQSANSSKIFREFDYFDQDSSANKDNKTDEQILKLEEEAQSSHLDIVKRFCVLFDSIYRYSSDLCSLLTKLDNDEYLHMSFNVLLNDRDGGQLLGESLYLLGVILLQLDFHIPGYVRERLLVSLYKWVGAYSLSNFQNVCHICERTGYNPNGNGYPKAYPVDYFRRVEFPDKFIKHLIDKFRNEDMYGSMRFYNPEHVSSALATQGCMIFIFLFFKPDILDDDEGMMRAIVDKFFNDRWNIPYFMGYTMDLNVIWRDFKAAYKAICITMDERAKSSFEKHLSQLDTLHSKITGILSDGLLSIEQILNNSNFTEYINLVRESNIVLRTLLLHSKDSNKRNNFFCAKDSILAFLLDLAHFEYLVKTLMKKAFDEKESLFNEDKEKAVAKMEQVASSFQEIYPDKKYNEIHGILKKISDNVASIEFSGSRRNRNTISKIIDKLKNIKRHKYIDQNIVICQAITDILDRLEFVTSLLSIDDDNLLAFDYVTDFSYGVKPMEQYIELMQEKIKLNPNIVKKLRATFLKMTSIMNSQLLRIIQSQSKDLESVSEHYSTTIVEFVRNVLDIIPISIFKCFDEIIRLRATTLEEIPSEDIQRENLKHYANLKDRARLSDLTKMISVMTCGVLDMNATLMGVITVDPKQMLEEGIRKQLVNMIIKTLYSIIVTQKHVAATADSFRSLVQKVGKTIRVIRDSFEYMSDYISIDGLHIWHVEYSRVICFLVEQDCNRYLPRKVSPQSSVYQSSIIPIVIPRTRLLRHHTCISELVNQLIELTKPPKSVYCAIIGGWLSPKSGDEIVGTHIINMLCKNIGIEAAGAIDTLLSFEVAKRLKNFFGMYKRSQYNGGKTIEYFLNTSINDSNFQTKYKELMELFEHDNNGWTDVISFIGRLQLIKSIVSSKTALMCKSEVDSLYNALKNTNNTVLQTIKHHYRDINKNAYPSECLITSLSDYLGACGMNYPLEKIYTVVEDDIYQISLILFLSTVVNIAKVKYKPEFQLLLPDGAFAHFEFTMGVITILKQLNVSHMYSYLTLVGKFINLVIRRPKNDTKSSGLPRSLENMLHYIKDFENLSKTPRRVMNSFVPQTIFDLLSI